MLAHVAHDLAYPQPLAGADEVGRGCIAGPIAAVGVSLDLAGMPGALLSAITDSKRLSAGRRERLALLIRPWCTHYHLAVRDAAFIDAEGIQAANRAVMFEATEGGFATRLVDFVGGITRHHPELTALVRGDQASVHVAAASILAKVWRDAYMDEAHERHPVYGFDRHRGYGAPAHLAALAEHGPCDEHRMSFAPLRTDDPATGRRRPGSA